MLLVYMPPIYAHLVVAAACVIADNPYPKCFFDPLDLTVTPNSRPVDCLSSFFVNVVTCQAPASLSLMLVLYVVVVVIVIVAVVFVSHSSFLTPLI